MANLNIQVFNQQFYDDIRNVEANFLTFIANEWHNQPQQGYNFDYGVSNNPTATPLPIFIADTDAIAHFSSAAAAQLLDDVNSEAGITLYTGTSITQVPASVGALLSSLTFDDIADGATNVAFTTTNATKLAGISGAALTNKASDLNNDIGFITASGAPVQSVVGRTGTVTLTSADVGLDSVDNTSDISKPVSTATQTALNAKFNNPAGTTAQYLRGDGTVTAFPTIPTVPTTVSSFTNDASYITAAGAPVQSVAGRTGAVTLAKADVGLGSVDNTTDLGKPVSTATQTSLNAKFTTPSGTTSQYVKGDGTLGTTPTGAKAYEGTTARAGAFPLFFSGTVATGVAVFQLTADGTSSGAALFPNGIISDSVSITPNDATSLYGFSWVFSNSNKTLTVTVNKSNATGVIALLGINLLGSPVAAANGTVVKLQVWGY